MRIRPAGSLSSADADVSMVSFSCHHLFWPHLNPARPAMDGPRRTTIFSLQHFWRWISISVVLTQLVFAQKDQDFRYEMSSPKGPRFWGGVCNNSTLQSPIDISTFAEVDQSLPVGLSTSYVRADATLYYDGYSPEMTGPFGNFSIGGKSYRLQNIHFHHQAEHTLDIHTRYPLEMHLVHQAEDGEVAAVAIFYEIGAPSPFFSQFFKQLSLINEFHRPDVIVRDMELSFDMSGKYARYVGSLTNPPCYEGVIWTIIFRPMTMSKHQFKQYTKNFPGMTARGLQCAHGMHVTTSSS